MIDIIKKIHYSPDGGVSGTGGYAQVTEDSINNGAILIGCSYSTSQYVIWEDEIDGLIEALQELRRFL